MFFLDRKWVIWSYTYIKRAHQASIINRWITFVAKCSSPSRKTSCVTYSCWPVAAFTSCIAATVTVSSEKVFLTFFKTSLKTALRVWCVDQMITSLSWYIISKYVAVYVYPQCSWSLCIHCHTHLDMFRLRYHIAATQNSVHKACYNCLHTSHQYKLTILAYLQFKLIINHTMSD